MSVILFNALVTLWLRAVSIETPAVSQTKPGGYADDIHAVSSQVQAAQQVVNIAQQYAELGGQEVSPDKSFAFAVTLPQRNKLCKISFGGNKLEVKSNVDLLGVNISVEQSRTSSTGARSKAGKRAQKTKARFQRLRYAPLDFESRETVAGVSCLPLLISGQTGETLPAPVLQSLRRAALQGIWHGSGRLSCAEVALALFLKGHRVDPVQASDFACIKMLRRSLSNVVSWGAAFDRKYTGLLGGTWISLDQ